MRKYQKKQMPNLLITGGAGYIGAVVSDLALRRGHRVRVVDALWFNKGVPFERDAGPHYEFIKGDIRDAALMERVFDDVDFIIHTAALVGEPAARKFPELARQVNYNASIDLISKAAEYGVKGFIFFSTCSNYGVSDRIAGEDAPLRPLSLYAETKVDVERYLMDKANGLDWVICRLSTAYGCSPRMRFDLTVNDFTMKAYLKKYLDVFLPHTYRPYIHIRDIAGVVMEIVKNFGKVKNGVFNIGFDGENRRKIEIAECVQNLVPGTRIEVVEGRQDMRDYRVDFSKLRRYLNVNNSLTVEDGVKEVLGLLEGGAIADPRMSCYYNTEPDLA